MSARSEIPESAWRLRREHRFDFKGSDEWKIRAQENMGGELLAQIY